MIVQLNALKSCSSLLTCTVYVAAGEMELRAGDVLLVVTDRDRGGAVGRGARASRRPSWPPPCAAFPPAWSRAPCTRAPASDHRRRRAAPPERRAPASRPASAPALRRRWAAEPWRRNRGRRRRVNRGDRLGRCLVRVVGRELDRDRGADPDEHGDAEHAELPARALLGQRDLRRAGDRRAAVHARHLGGRDLRGRLHPAEARCGRRHDLRNARVRCATFARLLERVGLGRITRGDDGRVGIGSLHAVISGAAGLLCEMSERVTIVTGRSVSACGARAPARAAPGRTRGSACASSLAPLAPAVREALVDRARRSSCCMRA